MYMPLCIYMPVCVCLCVYMSMCTCFLYVCMFLCVYTCVRTCLCVQVFCMCTCLVCVYMSVYTCFLYVYMPVCIHVCVYMFSYVYMSVYIPVCVHVCVCTCFLYVCMSCMCIRVCMCIEHVPMHAHGGQEKVVGVFFHHSWPNHLRVPLRTWGPGVTAQHRIPAVSRSYMQNYGPHR